MNVPWNELLREIEEKEYEAEGGKGTEDFALGTVIFAMAVGVLCQLYLTKLLQLPHTVLKLMIGVLMGILARANVGLFGAMLTKWVRIDPEILMVVFIPVLIFNSAFNTDVNVFQREFWQVITLAGPGTVIAAGLTAVIVCYWLPFNWNWKLGMAMGAALSAMDPPSLVALLKDQLCVSQRLTARIEGESLLNDGMSVVLFVLFKDALREGIYDDPGHIALVAARLALGGPLIGLAVGLIGRFVLGRVLDDAFSELTITIILCYSAYLIAESSAIQVSGILSVVTLGLFLSFHARGRFSTRAEESMVFVWGMLNYIAVTMVFFTAGLKIGNEVLFSPVINARAWGYLFALYLGVHLVRIAVVAICSPVLIAAGSRKGVDMRQTAVLAFGGLRGAIGLTLSLVLSKQEILDQDTRDRIQFFMWGVTALTLIVDGTIAQPLLSYLGLDRSIGSDTEVFTKACGSVEARLEHVADLLKGDRFLGDAHWEIVWRYIPVLTTKTYWHRIRTGNIVLSSEEEQDMHRFTDRKVSSSKKDDFFSRKSQRTSSSGKLYNCWQYLNDQFKEHLLGSYHGKSYTHVPRRLRYQWAHYHEVFNNGTEDVAVQIDMARTNALPQMSSGIDGWIETANVIEPCNTKYFMDFSTFEGPKNAGADSIGSTSSLEHQPSIVIPTPENGGTQSRQQGMDPDLVILAQGSVHGKSLAEEISLLRGYRVAAIRDVRYAELKLYEKERALELAAAISEDFNGSDYESRSEQKLEAVKKIRPKSLNRIKGTGLGPNMESIFLTDGYSVDKEKAPYTPDGNVDIDSNIDSALEAMTIKDAMAEARIRFLSAVKANYQERRHQGWLSASGARVLRDNIDTQLEDTRASLREWRVLARSFTLPTALIAPMRHLSLVRRLVDPLIYGRLALIFELASNFIAAHEDVDILQIIKEGPVAYQLASEKTAQLREARDTLVAQLPVFPELARSLKTQVAARYMLMQHRGMVEELYRQGHINDREYARLLHSNTVSRVKLDYHPHTDHIPERSELLKDVPFLRFLSDADRDIVLRNRTAITEEFQGANIVLMKERSADVSGRKKRGWYVVVRGSVRQTTRSVVFENGRQGHDYGLETAGALMTNEGLPINSVINGDTIGRNAEIPRVLRKGRVLHSGTVFGLDDQLLEIPYHSTYTTSSFAHLFFFDKTQILAMAEEMPELNRGLWWSLAVSVMRHHTGFRRMSLKDVYQVMTSAEFVDVRQSQKNSEFSGVNTVEQIRSSINSLYSKPKRGVVDSSLYKASGLIRNLTMKSLDPEGSKEWDSPEDYPFFRYQPSAGGQILLLRGRMLGREGTDSYSPLPEKTGVAIIDVSGPVDFTDDTVFFFLPCVLLGRTASPRQLLMHSIQKVGEEGRPMRNGWNRMHESRQLILNSSLLRIGSGLSISSDGSGMSLVSDDLKGIQLMTADASEAIRIRNDRDAELAAKAEKLSPTTKLHSNSAADWVPNRTIHGSGSIFGSYAHSSNYAVPGPGYNRGVKIPRHASAKNQEMNMELDKTTNIWSDDSLHYDDKPDERNHKPFQSPMLRVQPSIVASKGENDSLASDEDNFF